MNNRREIYLKSIIIIIFDQLIKVLIQSQLHIFDEIVMIPHFFSIFYVKNTGAAFSILENNTFLLIMISILFLVFIDSYIKKEKLANLSKLSFGIMIGGVCGNLIDRLLRGGVIDYLSFEIFTYQFPVFNLADIAIVIGVLLFLISEECIFRMKKEEREK